MLKISMTPAQVQNPNILNLAIMATVMGTNPEWNNGKVTYKFDDTGIQMVSDEALMMCIEVGADVEGVSFWVEITPDQFDLKVPDNFPDNKLNDVERTWIDYSRLEMGTKGKHLLSAVYTDALGINVKPDAATLLRLKGYFGNLIFNHSEIVWREENQI